MRTGRKTIFVFSFEPWGNMWYSKQHYAAELAKKHKVYFICPPKRWRLLDLFSRGVRLRKSAEGVYVVDYRNNLPIRILPRRLRHWAFRAQARKLSRLLSPDEGANILWSFCPTPVVLSSRLRTPGTKLIYHVVDPYHTFEADRSCAQQADLVVTVNNWFLGRYRELNPRTIMVPHGTRKPEVKAHASEELIPSAWLPYAVLAGSIDDRIDHGLLIATAQALPQVNLILIGPLYAVPPDTSAKRRKLLDLPNVFHAGPIHPDKLSAIVQGSLAGLIAYFPEPYAKEPEKPTGTPHKALSYLTQLKPVISTYNCYIPSLEGKGIYKVEDTAGFIQHLEQAWKGMLHLDEGQVRAYVRDHAYSSLVAGILGHLEGRSPAQVQPTGIHTGQPV